MCRPHALQAAVGSYTQSARIAYTQPHRPRSCGHGPHHTVHSTHTLHTPSRAGGWEWHSPGRFFSRQGRSTNGKRRPSWSQRWARAPLGGGAGPAPPAGIAGLCHLQFPRLPDVCHGAHYGVLTGYSRGTQGSLWRCSGAALAERDSAAGSRSGFERARAQQAQAEGPPSPEDKARDSKACCHCARRRRHSPKPSRPPAKDGPAPA